MVDVSLDHLRPSSSTMARRRPSGCLIQELPYGYSKVRRVVLFETTGIRVDCMMLRSLNLPPQPLRKINIIFIVFENAFFL